jgi:hypothetical protein
MSGASRALPVRTTTSARALEHLAQVLAPRRRAELGVERGRPARPRQQVGQLVGLEEVAEPVPDRDLGDFRHAAEVALLRRLRHALILHS